MIEIFKYAFSGFWTFAGFLLILTLFLKFFFVVLKLIARANNISKHGWPPPHVDADGDFKEQKEKDELS